MKKNTLTEKRIEKILNNIKHKKLKLYSYYNYIEDFKDADKSSWAPILTFIKNYKKYGEKFAYLINIHPKALNYKIPTGTSALSILVPIEYIDFANELIKKSKHYGNKRAKFLWIGSTIKEKLSDESISLDEISEENVSLKDAVNKQDSLEKFPTKDISAEVDIHEEISEIQIEKLITRIIPFDPSGVPFNFTAVSKSFTLLLRTYTRKVSSEVDSCNL